MTAGVVVVGSGQAGTTVATSLRDRGFDGSINLVGAEPHLPYERPPLSKQYLIDPDSQLDLNLRPADFYHDRDIRLQLGRTAVTIDRNKHSVLLDDGQTLDYTVLVLATGTRPLVPDLPGKALRGVHVLRTIDDAQRLRDEMVSSDHITAVGGGFIGMEMAAAAQKLGIQSCVLDIADRILQRAVTPTMSEYLTAFHRQRGTALHLGTGLTEIVGTNNRVSAVLTSTGKRIDTDTVVLAVGVRPNTEIASAAGLGVDNGIVVDNYLRTSDPNIFAIGDCANFPDAVSGRIRLESVQAATDHARLVANQIAGETVDPYLVVPWFWSHQGPMKLQIAGHTDRSDTDILRGDPTLGKFSVYRYTDGRLRAVESVNRPSDHVVARRLLAAGVSPTAEELTAVVDVRSLIPPVAITV
ncbi:NAD(P)/FAD-dependent oxidoreductase [Williamsia soli]|uniref:NAD(P)/FAD-dependent oxidoreductase n=1 Tax=Williamsia soli TaxID=364929 RepID=UPI001A9D681C|nr:FAD-dependent oxidoreductase [Williamsia soli]